VVKSVKNGRKPSKMIVPSGRLCVAIKVASEASATAVHWPFPPGDGGQQSFQILDSETINFF